MKLEELARILRLISANAEMPAFTIAEHLPFEAEGLRKLFADLPLFSR